MKTGYPGLPNKMGSDDTNYRVLEFGLRGKHGHFPKRFTHWFQISAPQSMQPLDKLSKMVLLTWVMTVLSLHDMLPCVDTLHCQE